MEVDVGALERAVTEFTEQSTALADLDVAGAFAGIDTALAGSLTGEAALWASSRAAAAVAVLADRLDGLARSAEGTARDYRASDGAAQRRLDGLVLR